MNKRIISAILSALLLFGAVNMPVLAEDEKVTLIVETEGAPLLGTREAALMGASEFLKTDEARDTEARLLSAQDKVKSAVKRRSGADADKGFTYTSVFNGFSMEARESDIEKIKSIDGVKNVYISEAVDIPDQPTSDGESAPGFGGQMMNTQAMYDNGYNGGGQAVAIIDAGFDVVHEFFSSTAEDPRLSKSYVKDLIENNELNAKAEANQVYKNAKIPFAYDYGDNDADVYYPQLSHGTHVAGIAAGKNGVFEGTTFSGVAPEAQLVLMKIADSEGSTYNSVIIAAMDDAAKMDVCAVNMSLGSTLANSPAYTTACDNMRNAGIAIISAAGNDDRYAETAENPDYSYIEYPAVCSASTAVASCDTDKRWLIGGGITLADGEKIVVDQAVYSELFFKKFSDKFYDYVYVGSETTPPEDVVKGKIVISVLNSGITSRYLLDCGAIGMIFVENDEIDGRLHTVSDEIPGLVVRRSYGEKLINAEDKRFKTDAEICTLYGEFPDAGISYFSNWATSSNLELKPEITAPGGDILSSVNGDEYENNNGTSMAAPQITGAMALMSDFVEAEHPETAGADKVALMENILMSSASLFYSDEEKTLPLSPRKQGAGLANLRDALTIPVILKGDSGKSKLSLGDMLGDEITLKFTAENLTDHDVIYDDISVCALTDGYESKNGENMISDSVPLEITAVEKPESVTVPANGETEVSVKITLNGEQTAANKEIFTNGFWVDGFITLSSKDGSVTKSSMPYTGFYGDWTAADAFSPSYFEEGGSAENGYIGYNSDVLGTNLFASGDEDKSEYESESYVGISGLTDNTGYWIRVRMLRALVDTTLTVKDSSGNVVYEKKLYDGLCRQLEINDYFENVSLDGLGLPEGDYTAVLSGNFVYGDKSRTEEKTYQFYIDSELPEIRDPRIYEEGGKKYASFKACDNRYLMGAMANDGSNTVSAAVKAQKEAEITLDITNLNEETLEFSVSDYAYNTYDFKIGGVNAEITDSITGEGSAAFIASIANNAADADADVIMALYDGDGVMIDADVQNVFIGSGENFSLAFSFENAPTATEAKLFVWEHDKLTPLCDPVIFTEF